MMREDSDERSLRHRARPVRPHPDWRRCFLSLIILFLAELMFHSSSSAQTMQLWQAPGGLLGTQVGSAYTASFGTLNALGVGTPTAGVTETVLSNGTLYYTPYQIQISGLPNGHLGTVSVYVSANFAHPSALIMQNCPSNASCTASGSYSVMSMSAATPSSAIPSPGTGNTTVTVGVGIFVPDNNGATAFSGNDSATITLRLTDTTRNVITHTVTINFTPQTLQRAVQLTAETATGGLTISPASDFSMNFGNVNGIGIAPSAGLTTIARPGGIVYATPYVLRPVFSDFTSTTASLSVYVSTNFVHPVLLALNDAASSGGPYNAISTSATTPTQITTTASNRAPVTRYLGLFVSNINGASAFTGTDTARLTFTLTVP